LFLDNSYLGMAVARPEAWRSFSLRLRTSGRATVPCAVGRLPYSFRLVASLGALRHNGNQLLQLSKETNEGLPIIFSIRQRAEIRELAHGKSDIHLPFDPQWLPRKLSMYHFQLHQTAPDVVGATKRGKSVKSERRLDDTKEEGRTKKEGRRRKEDP